MAPTTHKTPTTNPNKHCPTQSPSSPPKTRDQTENHIKRPSRASSSSHRYTSKRPTPVRLYPHLPNQPPYFTIQPQKRRQRTPSIPDHVVKEHPVAGTDHSAAWRLSSVRRSLGAAAIRVNAVTAPPETAKNQQFRGVRGPEPNPQGTFTARGRVSKDMACAHGSWACHEGHALPAPGIRRRPPFVRRSSAPARRPRHAPSPRPSPPPPAAARRAGSGGCAGSPA